MTTEPTTPLLEQLHDQVDAETTQRVVDEELGNGPFAGVDAAEDTSTDDDVDVDDGPTIDIVIDGRTLDDAEVEALLQKPMEELNDAEREGLQPLFDAVGTQQRQGIDPIALATDLLTEAAAALLKKPPVAQRLEHKIALGQAIATLVQARATQHLALLTQQQLQLVMQAQQAQVARAAGPAGIVIPQANVRLHG